ncbi:hypothetical protein Taro_030887 [Colocasia esculenta]|uniref:Uncharacterized protein n=1 Tax=Colocasia esculenta TaxID=4460 RepID=A0A843VXD5_COLES|nr:hypothetical protein [Colocasia esculenta]
MAKLEYMRIGKGQCGPYLREREMNHTQEFGLRVCVREPEESKTKRKSVKDEIASQIVQNSTRERERMLKILRGGEENSTLQFRAYWGALGGLYRPPRPPKAPKSRFWPLGSAPQRLENG